MILEMNEERRRISLGIKQCFSNPGVTLQRRKIRVTKSQAIKSITDFECYWS